MFTGNSGDGRLSWSAMEIYWGKYRENSEARSLGLQPWPTPRHPTITRPLMRKKTKYADYFTRQSFCLFQFSPWFICLCGTSLKPEEAENIFKPSFHFDPLFPGLIY